MDILTLIFLMVTTYGSMFVFCISLKLRFQISETDINLSIKECLKITLLTFLIVVTFPFWSIIKKSKKQYQKMSVLNLLFTIAQLTPCLIDKCIEITLSKQYSLKQLLTYTYLESILIGQLTAI